MEGARRHRSVYIWGAMLRTLIVASRLAPLVASFVRDFHRWLWFGGPVARTRAFHEQRAARLVATVASLGPAFVKMAQIVGSRADLIPEPYLAALGTLHDQVPPVPIARVRTIVESEYGQSVESLFETFDWTPLAAASLGQVHRARYDGEEVVVKVLRPNVERVMADDLRAAEALFAFAERRWGQGAAAGHFRGLHNVLREFGGRVWEEMDFRREAAYAQETRANFAGRAGVKVPRVIAPLVRQRALVLEYMPGVRIDRLQDRVAQGRLDAQDLVRHVIELYMQMMLVDGLFHADPHPGNLLVQDDGTIVVLDFGMVVRVDRTLRRRLARTAFAGIQRDTDGLIAGFYELGVLEPQADPAVARQLVEALLEIAHTQQTTTLDRMQLVAERVMATLYGFPVTLPSDLVYFARTAALIEGLGTRYDARFNAVTFAAPVALRMRGAILASLRDPDTGDTGLPTVDWARLFGVATEQAVEAVSRVGRGLLTLFERVTSELGAAVEEALAPAPERRVSSGERRAIAAVSETAIPTPRPALAAPQDLAAD
jgi:predicted unusual protein kinase regulating ubiquinone biosynthesis (AarF/ABC1/UbiB family)